MEKQFVAGVADPIPPAEIFHRTGLRLSGCALSEGTASKPLSDSGRGSGGRHG